MDGELPDRPDTQEVAREFINGDPSAVKSRLKMTEINTFGPEDVTKATPPCENFSLPVAASLKQLDGVRDMSELHLPHAFLEEGRRHSNPGVPRMGLFLLQKTRVLRS